MYVFDVDGELFHQLILHSFDFYSLLYSNLTAVAICLDECYYFIIAKTVDSRNQK